MADVYRIRLIGCHLSYRKIMKNEISFESVYDSNNLFRSFYKWSKTSSWKYKTQQYEANLLVENNRSRKDLKQQKYELSKDTKPFVLMERDKVRYVTPQTVRDSVVLTSFCENVSHKVVYPKLISNNGSSVKGKGINDFRKHLERDLHRFWINHGNNGYILLIDFRKYYDNMKHDDIKEMLGKILPDDDSRNFFNKLVDNSKVDVSALSDKEYEDALNGVFNSLEFHDKYGILKEGKKFLPKSTGIGSPNSCDIALYYAHEIDDYVKIVRGIKAYGRFTDDSYAIHESKEYLEELLKDITQIANKRGIHINDKKTKIVSLKDKFEILHTDYILRNNGKLVKEVETSTIKREKKKLRKFRRMLNLGEKPIGEIYQEYRSWRGSLKYYNSTKRIMKMDIYYNSLFGEETKEYKRERQIMKHSNKLIRKHLLYAVNPNDIHIEKIPKEYMERRKRNGRKQENRNRTEDR